jgi:bifunctional non-homologous end joining protein LigD
MAAVTEYREIEVAGRTVRISNPSKMYFPAIGATKGDLVDYHVAVAGSTLVGCRERPTMLHRYPDGVDGEDIYQKRVPHPPDWLDTVTVTFPSGREARFLAPTDAAHVIWAVNLGCFEMNPWNVRRSDVEHPDELRIDLDPTPDAPFSDVRTVAMQVREVLPDYDLVAFPKTSGKRGIQVYVRIAQEWTFQDVRRAALALAREVEKRMPKLVTTAWWREERHGGVFIDYNQNARDRTIASAYSVRPTPDARVSTPISWDEVPDVEPEALTMRTVPVRFRSIGDPGADIDNHVCRLDALLELSERQRAEGLDEAPYPPHFPKSDERRSSEGAGVRGPQAPDKGEPARVQPSRRKREPTEKGQGRWSRRRGVVDE